MRRCPSKMEEKSTFLIKEDGRFSLGRHCVDQARETQSHNFAQDEQSRRQMKSRQIAVCKDNRAVKHRARM